MSIRWSVAASLAAVIALPCGSGAQPAHSPADSSLRATAVIDRAVAAHGGLDALRAARHLRVIMRGHDFHRTQSRRVQPPYDSTLRTADLMLDLDRGQIVATLLSGYPGGFVRSTRFITHGDRGFTIDPRARQFRISQWPPVDRQWGILFDLPQFRLLAALEAGPPEARRWLGTRRLASGATVEAVHVPMPEGEPVTLGFDPRTGRLRAVISPRPDVLLGDTELETEYLDYRMIGGVLLPVRRLTWRGGEVVTALSTTSAEAGYAVPDSLLSPPSGYADAAAQAGATSNTEAVRELASGVWAIRGGGSWSLLVDFDDHLMVIDAAPRAAPDVIAHAATLAPGKPIRWVVPTHHHDDHFAGVRHFAAAGAITVTTPGNVDIFRRIVSAPSSKLQPNGPAATPSARVETVRGSRTFSDGRRTVEIHDIGRGPHAEEMLVAWFPAEGILFQGDLIDTPGTGMALRGANSETTIRFAEWLRQKGWRVRTIAGTHALLPSPAVLDEILKQPLLPPE